MQDELISIQKAADYLGVSTKTLRRWEARGILIPQRTSGNQRRYLLKELEDFKIGHQERKKQAEDVITSLQPLDTLSYIKLEISKFPFSKKLLLTLTPVLILFLTSGVLVKDVFFANRLVAPVPSEKIVDSKAVLGDSTQTPNYVFKVNVPSTFSESANFMKDITVNGQTIFSGGIVTNNKDVDAGTGKVTGSNLVYSVAAGDGLSVSGGQNATLTNTGVLSLGGSTGKLNLDAGSGISVDGLKITNSDTGSAQDIFKNVVVGINTIKAGSNNDTLNLSAGAGVTLSADETTKTITISSSNGGGGVTSLNSQTGALTLGAGTGLSLSGLTFTNTGVTSLGGKNGDLLLGTGLSLSGSTISNSGVLSLGGQIGALNLTAGAGISTLGTTITNTDLGSSQNIFKNFSVGGVPLTAALNNDTLNIASGSGITVTTDTGTKTLTIASNITNSTINSVSGWTQSGNYVTLTNPANYVGIGTSNPKSPLDVFGNITIDDSANSIDSNTKFLLHMDGTNGSTSFTDSSSNGYIVSANGSAQISTTQSKFGGASGYFDGSTSYLTSASNSDWNFGTGDFTVDTWIYPVSRVDSYPGVFSNYNNFSAGSLAIFAGHGNANSTKYQVAFNGVFPAIQSTASIAYNTWTHIAVVRSGGVITLYINGVANGTYNSSASVSPIGSNIYIGTAGDNIANGKFNGYIDEFRVSKGIARWTSNFTPSTQPYGTPVNYALRSGNIQLGTFDIYDQTNGISRLAINNSGFVGIGTTNPSATLDVVGNASVSGNLTVNGSIISGGTTGANGWFQRNSGLISPTNITDDFAIGGTATSSALFSVSGLTGNLSMSGTATIAPTIPSGTALTLRASTSGSGNVFNITNAAGNTSFLSVDSSGVVTVGGSTLTNSGAIHLTNSSNAILSTEIAGGWTMNSNTFTYRRIITVINNDATNTMPSGFQVTVSSSGSDAVDICAQTRTDNNDIRMANGTTEIARNVIRNCSTSLNVSFLLQNAIAPLGRATYYLYYGNPALATVGPTYIYQNLPLDSADNVATWSPSAYLSLSQSANPLQEGTGSIKVNSTGNSDGALNVSNTFALDTTSSLPNGLVSYYKFDETSGNIFYDSMGTNNGNFTGVSIVAGKLNNARSFAGSSVSNGTVSGPVGLPTGAAARSVFAWVKPTASGTTGALVSWGTGSTGHLSNLDIVSGKAYFAGYSADVTGTTSLVGGTWYLIGYTYDGTSIRIYVNGVLDAGPTSVALNTTAGTNMTIGRDIAQSVYLNGVQDETGIWNRALTQTEITNLYNTGSPDAYSNGYNISTQNNGSRTCSDGGDAVAYTTTATASAGISSIVLSSTPSAGCLSAGDEVVIMNMQGTATNNSTVGQYESETISSVSGATINLVSPLTKTYDGTTQKIMIQRVPHYTSVNVNANSTLTASAWNGSKGGLLLFRSSGAVNNSGTISGDGLGYRGGSGGTGVNTGTGAQNGESFDGYVGSGGNTTAQGVSGGGNGNGNNTLAAAGARGGGGGGGGTTGAQGDESGAGGAGGGYAGGGGGGAGGTDSNNIAGAGGTGGANGIGAGGGGGTGGAGGNAGSAGAAGYNGSLGGAAGSGTSTGQGGGSYSTSASGGGGGGGGQYGDATLSKLYLGSGGGGGGGFSNASIVGQSGNSGGGAVVIFAPVVNNLGNGEITSNGYGANIPQNQGGGGGAGSGGSVLINATTINTNNLITANGGSNSTSNSQRGGGAGGGGIGRIVLSGNTVNGTSTPTFGSAVSSGMYTDFAYPYTSTLTLTPTDLTGYAGLNVYLYSTTASNSALIEFSNDGGTTWNTSSPIYIANANTWTLGSYDISVFSGSQKNNVTKVRLRFSAFPGTIYYDNVYASPANFGGTSPSLNLAAKILGAADLTLNAQGSGYIDLNYDPTNSLAGTGGIRLFNGSSTQVFALDSLGNMTWNGGATWKPSADSTTALSIKKANGDNFLTLDSVNNVASFAASLTLATSSAQIQTTNNQLLVIGGDTTGDIQFKPGNTTTGLYLAVTGNVGVGTQTPSARFTVVGPLSTSATPSNWTQAMVVDSAPSSSQTITEFRVAGTRRGSIRIDSSGNMVLQGNGSGGTYLNWDEGTGGTYFGNGSGTVVGRIDNAGNSYVTGTFGVGTTGPQASMEVRKAASDLLKLTNTTGGAGSTSYIDFQTYNGSGVNTRIGSVDGGTYNGSLVFETNAGGVNNGTTTNEVMRITSTKQVGIGTTAPVGMFNVVGTSSGQALFNLNNLATDQNIMTASASGATKFVLDNNGSISTANGSQWKVLSDSTTALQVANAAGSSIMNFDTTNSRVGVGTTSSLQAFDVNGGFNLFNSTSKRGDLYSGINLDKIWNSPSTFGETNATFSAGLQNPVTNYLTLAPNLGIDLGNGSDGALTVNTSFLTDTGNSLNTGLSSYWKLDEATASSTIVDSVGTANGTAVNTTAVAGISGYARNYTAGTGYIQTSYAESGISAFSISAWIKTTSVAGYIFYDRNNPAITLGWGKTGDGAGANGQAYIIVDGSGIAIGLHSTVTINDGNWHHVVGTWSGGGSVTPTQFHIYVDGLNKDGVTSTTGATSAPLTANTTAKLGYNFNTVGGAIDEVGVWTKALSTQEVTDLYNSGASDTYVAPYNISTQNNVASGRACADGGDAVAYTSTANTAQYATSITLSSAPSAGCLSTNDEVLIINMQGTSGDNSNVGKYEIKRVSSVSGSTLNLVQPLNNAYNGTTQKIMVQRVPQYTNVTVSQNSVLTASSWNAATGGVLAFKASGTVSVTGQIKADGLGYRGGTGGTGNAGGTSGESYDGIVGSGGIGTATGTAGGGTGDALSTNGTTAVRGGGGGGGADSNGDSNDGSGGGGGGGYAGGGGGGGSGMDNNAGNNTGGTGGATGVSAGGGGGNGNGGVGYGGAAGSAGQGPYGGAAGSGSTTGQGGGGASGGNGGAGGAGGGGLYGTADLSQIYMGSGGGGAGGTYKTGATASSGGGGGGIVMISGGTVSVSGSITSNGVVGGSASGNYGGGGGGAGGSVRILGNTVSMGTSLINVNGGGTSGSTGQSGGGGAGGVGRIAVFSPSLTGTTNPTYTALSNPGESYDSGEQTWYSAIIDMGAGKTAKPNILNVNYLLDGTDNIAPKFEIQASNTGLFTGEEVTYPNGQTTWYQAGGTYPVNNGTDTDITGQVQRYRYWRVIVKIDTGANTSDTPVIRSIELKDYAPSITTLAGGNVGVGTLLPAFKLDVQDIQIATSTAMFTNLSTSNTAGTLALKVGSTNPGTGNYFLTFLDGNGNIVGKVQGNGSHGVTYATTGVDFAEYFRKENPTEELNKGDAICLGPTGGATKCENGTNILGVVSGKAGFVGGSQHDQDPNYVAVGLIGQLPVNVSSESGKINPGDRLTVDNGVVKTASSEGEILGLALEGYNGEGKSSINVRINTGWYNPNSVPGSQNSTQDLLSRIDILSQNINTLQNIVNFNATASSFMNSSNSSTSGLLSQDELNIKDATLSGNLMVLGRTNLNDLGVTGKITSGLMSIAGLDTLDNGDIASTINSVGDLYLQNKGMGGVNILSGLVTIDKVGNMDVKAVLSAKSVETENLVIKGQGSTGTATLPKGKTSIQITSDSVTSTSKVLVTPNTLIDIPLVVTTKSDGSFVVAISTTQNKDVKFDWWVVGTK